jgi:hypothetical protein
MGGMILGAILIPCHTGTRNDGYQLTGQVVRQEEAAIPDGLAEIEQKVRFPRVERFLLRQVRAIEDFHFAPSATGCCQPTPRGL